MVPSKRAAPVGAAMLSRLLRDLRHPARLQRNPLLTRLAPAPALGTPGAVRTAIEVQLYRLPLRPRTIIERYEMNGEPLAGVAQALSLSRRQLFRDRANGLTLLANLLFEGEPRGAEALARREAKLEASVAVRDDSVSLAQSAICGLRYAGAVSAAIDRLHSLVPVLPSRSQRVDALLQIAEISMDYGDRPTERRILSQLRSLDPNSGDCLEDLRATIRCLMIESDLVTTCDQAVARNELAANLLRQRARGESHRRDVVLLVGCLCLLYYDYERASLYTAARDAVAEAAALVKHFAMESLPVGVETTIATAYDNARQRGTVGEAIDSLREPLDRCLANGWTALAARIGVACLSLSNMRSRYGEALQWYEWLSSVSASRLPQYDRKMLVVESAHALTMMGRAHQAICTLNGSPDEGYAYVPSVKVRRAEALEALGDVRGAIRDASDALVRSERAHYDKGIARSKRVLASCYDAVGETRLARTHLAECVELSTRSQSAYDLLRAMVTQSHVLKEDRFRQEAIGLARVLLEAGGRQSGAPPNETERLLT